MRVADELAELKDGVKRVASKYSDRLSRSRRLFVEDRAKALEMQREVEYEIKEKISDFYDVRYSDIAFAGSAQLGFSPHKNRIFVPATSDLDVACISASLYQKGWADVITSTRAFTDDTKFSGLSAHEISRFKDGLLRRGMMRVEIMPRSRISLEWKAFEERLSRAHASIFGSIKVAIYLSEYAFCWKQDSAISTILRS